MENIKFEEKTIMNKEYTIDGKLFEINVSNKEIVKLPYLLFVPDAMDENSKLIVDFMNVGKYLDDYSTMMIRSTNIRKEYISDITKQLSIENRSPILMPIVPSLKGYNCTFFGSKVRNNETEILEENINKGIINIRLNDIEKFKNIDEQIKGMVEESYELIKKISGLELDEKVIIHGYSAGGHLANGFTALHPEMVDMEIVGGLDGVAILPVSNVGTHTLNYPLGTNDIENFDIEKFSEVKHYFYMGNQDFGNCAEMIDGRSKYSSNYTDEEVNTITSVYGNIKTHDRMQKISDIYCAYGMDSSFEIFDGDHMSVQVNPELSENVSMFVSERIEKNKTNDMEKSKILVKKDKSSNRPINGYASALILALISGFTFEVFSTLIYMMIN